MSKPKALVLLVLLSGATFAYFNYFSHSEASTMRDGAEQSTKRNVTAFRVQSSIGRCTANPFVQGDPVADAE